MTMKRDYATPCIEVEHIDTVETILLASKSSLASTFVIHIADLDVVDLPSEADANFQHNDLWEDEEEDF